MVSACVTFPVIAWVLTFAVYTVVFLLSWVSFCVMRLGSAQEASWLFAAGSSVQEHSTFAALEYLGPVLIQGDSAVVVEQLSLSDAQ